MSPAAGAEAGPSCEPTGTDWDVAADADATGEAGSRAIANAGPVAGGGAEGRSCALHAESAASSGNSGASRVWGDFTVAWGELSMTATEVYRKTRKVPDLFWNTYVCRPIAAVVVNAIEATRITPNQVTLSAVFVALGSVVLLLLWPGHWGLIVAVIVFELSYVLDCADGMLARFRGTASPVGHLLDFLMDELKAFCLLAAVAVRLFLEQKDVRFLLLGLFGLVVLASGIALTTFIRRPEVAGPPAASYASTPGPRSALRRLLGLVESAAKFVIHYPSYLLYVALIGRIELYFLPYVAVNALYAARAFAGVALRFGRS